MIELVVALVALYVAVCVVLWLVQEKLVFFPNPDAPALPLEGDVEPVTLRTSDGVAIEAWLLAAPDATSSNALVFCHGNGGHRAGRLDSARVFRDMGFSVLLLDYRGYGGSEGRPTEQGTYLDAEAAYDFLVERGHERIAGYGESVGVAVVVELARRRDLDALVLESGFTSIPDMGRVAYPWLPSGRLARVKYDNLAKIGALTAPVLLVHSPADGLVPYEQAERLRDAAPEGTRLLATEAGHNDGGFLRRAEWIEEVRAFLADAQAKDAD